MTTKMFYLIFVFMMPIVLLAQKKKDRPEKETFGEKGNDWEFIHQLPTPSTIAVVEYLTKNNDIENPGKLKELIVFTGGNSIFFDTYTNPIHDVGSYHTGGQIQSKPTFAHLSGNYLYPFVASADGWLYKFDLNASYALAVINAHTQKVTLRRSADSGCSVKDMLLASPVIQFAAPPLNVDVVFVGTAHGCGSVTTNMIYALSANDITLPPKWVFNEFGDYSVNTLNALLLDSLGSVLYGVTNISGYQNTLWCINTTNGELKWASNIGLVKSPPLLGNTNPQHLYAVNTKGRMYAFDPYKGYEYWTLDLTDIPGVMSLQELTLDKNRIGVTLSDGTVCLVVDKGSNSGDGEILWAKTFYPNKATTSKIASEIGKIYVGLDNGTVHQLDLATGLDEGYSIVSGSAPLQNSPVSAVTIFKQGSQNKLIASAGVYIKQFSVPFQAMPQW